ncbi:hypothetical protein [Paracoccus saliphilus]|uniref:Uncharacterized protein n=1 Tax=Paracoccus saliphilus TaxID=405559 RepID=A0AA45W612_9RHOB|nr:hypothetical protein [Paracoccus saliphilus]WCR01623.1 hypothetical protein JHX88_11830 [Paracoccus saliphilus]SIS98630.1 hypothetical protein SAMN05421772_11149 [Paracoccus saliphilus]
MTTYTVFNMEADFGFEEWKGLTLLGAVGMMMQLSNCSCTFRRDSKGVMHMEVYPECAATEGALQSSNPDDDAAGQEIFERFATGKIILPSTYYIVSDEKHEEERQKYYRSMSA